MSVDVLTFGLNHTSAPVSVRERVSFPVDLVKPALEGLRSTFGSRCKKPPFCPPVIAPKSIARPTAHVADQLPAWLADHNRLDAGTLHPHLYQYQQDDAVRHAFRVASGLDSMVLGETQIVGQMKDAVRAAGEAGSLGTLLHQMFQRTFSVAKEVRSQTAIGAQSVSMAAAAVRLAERVFGNLRPGPHAVHRRGRNDRTVRYALRRATSAQHGGGEPYGSNGPNCSLPGLSPKP